MVLQINQTLRKITYFDDLFDHALHPTISKELTLRCFVVKKDIKCRVFVCISSRVERTINHQSETMIG